MTRIPISDTVTCNEHGQDFRGTDGTPRAEAAGVADLVRAVRSRCNLSAAALADCLDVDPRNVRRWTAGEMLPQPERRRQLAQMLAATLPRPSAEDPVVLATLVAPALADGLSPSRVDQLVADARDIARAIDRGIEAERRVREIGG